VTELWSNAIRRLSTKIARQNYEMWLRPIECRAIDGSTITLRAPNQYVRLWFESNYLSVVLDELRGENSIEYVVEFEPDESIVPQTTRATSEAEVSVEATPAPSPSAAPVSAGGGLEVVAACETRPEPERVARDLDIATLANLNPRYTFDTFVAGPSNQLAYAASQAAASTYPPKYNPVFICGGVGLGKTHLLHSIGHIFRATRPESRILYISGECFMNEYIHAIRTNRMHDFRRLYRESCDVLLVDDVQFLAGKDGTQDEFFHTFNALHDAHRQIVLTADRKPYEISDIADRLRTRFAWGLMADIEAPELEVRVAILRKKAAAESNCGRKCERHWPLKGSRPKALAAPMCLLTARAGRFYKTSCGRSGPGP
jgi:chromosomal replication initiator protein